MRKKLYISIAAFLVLVACTNDLNVEPLDPTVSTHSVNCILVNMDEFVLFTLS